jgi:hypothetical protein
MCLQQKPSVCVQALLCLLKVEHFSGTAAALPKPRMLLQRSTASSCPGSLTGCRMKTRMKMTKFTMKMLPMQDQVQGSSLLPPASSQMPGLPVQAPRLRGRAREEKSNFLQKLRCSGSHFAAANLGQL